MVRFPKCRTEVLYPTPGRSGREEPITPPAMFVFPPPADVPRRRAGAELHCWFTSEKKSQNIWTVRVFLQRLGLYLKQRGFRISVRNYTSILQLICLFNFAFSHVSLMTTVSSGDSVLGSLLVVSLFIAGRLDYTIFKGPFQLYGFCDSMTRRLIF